MNKFLFFSLLLTPVVSYCMEKENKPINIFTPENLPHLTESLCASNNYTPWGIRYDERTCRSYGIRVDIGALSRTNKVLHDYYAQEKTKQYIIDLYTRYRSYAYRGSLGRPCCNSHLFDMAKDLGCHTIAKKIEYFWGVTQGRGDFSEDDKNETWYLSQEILLYTLIASCRLEQAYFIIKNVPGLRFCYGYHNILKKIAEQRYVYRESDPTIATELLEIAQQLLKRGIFADGREDWTTTTPLMDAVCYDDKGLGYQLILHGARSFQKHFDPYRRNVRCVFDFHPKELKEKWLHKFIDKVDESRKDRKV